MMYILHTYEIPCFLKMKQILFLYILLSIKLQLLLNVRIMLGTSGPAIRFDDNVGLGIWLTHHFYFFLLFIINLSINVYQALNLPLLTSLIELAVSNFHRRRPHRGTFRT